MLSQMKSLLILERADAHLEPLNSPLMSSIALAERDPAEEEAEGEREEVSQLSAELPLEISSRLVVEKFELQKSSALPRYDRRIVSDSSLADPVYFR